MKKSFKIGEYAIGGIIEVEKKRNVYVCRAKDYYTKETLLESHCNDLIELKSVLEEWSTPYYAETIINKLK